MYMTKKIMILLTLLAWLNHQAISQEKEKRLSVFYLGEYYTHPGLGFSYAQDFHSKTKEKIKKNGKAKVKEYRFFWSGKFGMYHQKESHTGVILTGGIGYRKTKASGFFTEYNLGVGSFRQILSGNTYEVNEEGSVNTIKHAFRRSLVNSLSIAIGKDLSPQLKIPISVIWTNGLWLRYPYNGYLLPQFFCELGVSYKF